MSRPRAVLWMDTEEWKKQASSEAPPGTSYCLQKVETDSTPKAVDGMERAIRFVVSRNTIDRDNDTINQHGWGLKSFLKNPVVPFAHDYRSLPVARAVNTAVVNDELVSTAVFPVREVYAFADTVYQMLVGGFLNAVSVGFRPSKHEFNKDRGGVDFLEQELLEYSVVPVPAHPEALVQARSAGIDTLPLKAWAEKTLDEWHDDKGIWLPKDIVTDMFKSLKPLQVTVEKDEVPAEAPAPEASAEVVEQPVEVTSPEGDVGVEEVVASEDGAADLATEDPPAEEEECSHESDEELIALELDEPAEDTAITASKAPNVVTAQPERSPEVANLLDAVKGSGLLKENKTGAVQKLNPIVLNTPLPGSYEDTARQLTEQAGNFLTANGQPFRPDMDKTAVVATFVDHALFCTIGMDRPWSDDPCYRGNFTRREDLGGQVQWTGAPTKVDVEVNVNVVSAQERAWKYTEEDEYAIEFEDEKAVDVKVEIKDEMSAEEVSQSIEDAFTRIMPSLTTTVLSAAQRAIRLQQGRVD